MGTRVEADFLISPSPPFHMLGGVHSTLPVLRFGPREPEHAEAPNTAYDLRSLPTAAPATFWAPASVHFKEWELSRALLPDALQADCSSQREAFGSGRECAVRAIQQRLSETHAAVECRTGSIRK